MVREEMQEMMRRCCVQCGKPIRGRIDKKFCDDYCRNTFNNKLKGMSNNLVRNINNALRKNHRILEELLGEANEGMTRANKERLVRLGFQFKYVTHTHKNKGKHYHYCYDHGYLPLENDWFLIVKNAD